VINDITDNFGKHFPYKRRNSWVVDGW
jgi:hypothetical protein